MNIAFEDFAKLEIRIGKILTAERIEGTDKLLKLEVDFGPSASHSTVSSDRIGSGSLIRQIVSGIAQFYAPEKLVGKQFPFVVNLEPRIIRGVESQGMILAISAGEKIVLLKPQKKVPAGSVVK